MLAFEKRAIVPPHVMVRHLDGESVLLNLETERYFGLDATGTRMWQLVTTCPNIDAAYAQLLDEYEVEPQVLRGDLAELTTRLVEHGLLQVVPVNVGTVPAV